MVLLHLSFTQKSGGRGEVGILRNTVLNTLYFVFGYSLARLLNTHLGQHMRDDGRSAL